MNLAAGLASAARRWPTSPAIARGTRVVHDYATFARRVAALADSMRSAGLARGDRVALVSRNSGDYLEALYACWWAGLCAVPVNAKLHPAELGFVLGDAGVRVAFVDDAWASALGGVQRDLQLIGLGGADYRRWLDGGAPGEADAAARDTPAWLFYTSGTTGRPKGVVLSHGNLAAMTEAFVANVETIAPGDAILHPAPLSHGSGLYAIPHVAHGAVQVVPESGGFDAAETAMLMAHWPRALFFAAPTMVKRLVRDGDPASRDLARFKCLVFGGGPMYVADLREAFAALGPRLAQIYGQGESPMTIPAMRREEVADAIARSDDARLASVGRAQSGIALRIGTAMSESAAGEPGEILVQGATVMQGYWNNPAATQATLAGGWLHTGDVGTLDAEGYLTLLDRSKDLVISGGSNIYPREVEEVLQAHPAVAEVAVVGRAHPEWGEEVVACLVLREGADESTVTRECDALCLARIARFKRPKAYVLTDALPKNNAGKIVKTEVRAMVAARARGDAKKSEAGR
jgi:long-chain acyl-CoA synthetase